MIIEIIVPDLGESINEVEIGEWLIEVGDWVERDDEVVAVESDKATVEIPAPQGGVLVEIVKQQGEKASIGEVVGRLDTEGEGKETEPEDNRGRQEEEAEPEKGRSEKKETVEKQVDRPAGGKPRIMPAAARVLAQYALDPDEVVPTGPGGRILKEDALRAMEEKKSSRQEPEEEVVPDTEAAEHDDAQQHRVPMSPIRRTIAGRLLDAKRNMALLTTFNEADMSAVKQARSAYGEEFFQKHGVRLGFMSFFVKAAVTALVDFPMVNAMIDNDDIVYHRSCDIGIAIGGGKGLVVPVLRRAERLGFAEIERKIGELAEKAQKNKLTMKELVGGTFTISNGGIYGSMLSTPIVNPPQSAILGLHAIKDRPVALAGEVVIRPIMYLALTYDHRLIDGREAVGFLKTTKERIEEPQKLLLEI